MYVAISENLTELGGRMGTERTWENWRRYFYNKEEAIRFCKDDYAKARKRIGPLERFALNKDLRFVMYHVKKVKVYGGPDKYYVLVRYKPYEGWYIESINENIRGAKEFIKDNALRFAEVEVRIIKGSQVFYTSSYRGEG